MEKDICSWCQVRSDSLENDHIISKDIIRRFGLVYKGFSNNVWKLCYFCHKKKTFLDNKYRALFTLFRFIVENSSLKFTMEERWKMLNKIMPNNPKVI